MTYQTVEAYLEKNVVTLPKFFRRPDKKVKVLITFVDNDIDYGLYEIPDEEVTNELRELSQKALKKDKKLFSNL